MHPATWLFYAAVTLFLGLLSVAQGGAIMLARVLGGPEYAEDPEAIVAILLLLSVLLSVIFLTGGVREVMKGYFDGTGPTAVGDAGTRGT